MRNFVAVCAFVCCCTLALAQPYSLETFDDLSAVTARRGFSAAPAETKCVAADAAARGAGAVTVTLPPKGKVTIPVSDTLLKDVEGMDRCNGVRLWLKGDGSDGYGCVAFGSESAFTYELWFPLKDTTWHQVTCRLDELVPMSAVWPIGTPGGAPASSLGTITIGTRWYLLWNNEPMPTLSFSIDDVELISDAPAASAPPPPTPFREVLTRLKAKQPVHWVCMGDSITAGTGLQDKYQQQYAAVLQRLLRERLGYDGIRVESRAVGGARIWDARVWAPRDLAGQPDLVTICYGYNDKSGAQTKDYFKYSLTDYIMRIRRLTDGHAAIVPITTLPGGQWRFTMMDDYAQGVREVCAAEGLPCLDLAAAIKPMGRVAWEQCLGDRAHPNAQGHELLATQMADWVMKQIAAL